MKTKQVALIRGINVGRAKRVAMAELRTLVEELGYIDVRTLLNSGNVVFTAPGKVARDAAPRIEAALAKKLGVSARVTVLTAAELAVVVAENSIVESATDPSRLLVTVLSNPADRLRLEPLTQEDWSTEILALGTHAAYLWCPEGILASRLAGAVNRVLRDATTARNWTTITKLHALAGGMIHTSPQSA